jgi:hypothetical protein
MRSVAYIQNQRRFASKVRPLCSDVFDFLLCPLISASMAQTRRLDEAEIQQTYLRHKAPLILKLATLRIVCYDSRTALRLSRLRWLAAAVSAFTILLDRKH